MKRLLRSTKSLFLNAVDSIARQGGHQSDVQYRNTGLPLEAALSIASPAVPSNQATPAGLGSTLLRLRFGNDVLERPVGSSGAQDASVARAKNAIQAIGLKRACNKLVIRLCGT